ncbi:MAG: peptidylprolyl isomerase, partial [Oscillospiraceae bacterium]
MKKTILLCIIAMVLALSLFGCATKEETADSTASDSKITEETTIDSSAQSQQKPKKKEKLPVTLKQFAPLKKGAKIVVLETTMGVIKIAFFPNEAPQAVENFLGLVDTGYYNGLTFHRVADDFMIQSGDPIGDGTAGESF